jgi:hypothetical protein
MEVDYLRRDISVWAYLFHGEIGGSLQEMNFSTAQLRVVAHVRRMVCNGHVTERALARKTGISQPHLHNVLKGARSLTPEVGDLILQELKLDLLDLVPREEWLRRRPD